MKKYLIINIMFFYQDKTKYIIYNIKKEIREQQKKQISSQNVLPQENNIIKDKISHKNNYIKRNSNIKMEKIKIIIIILFLISFLFVIFSTYSYMIFNEENLTIGEGLPCLKKASERQDFIQEYKEMKDKKFFLYHNKDRFCLFEEKNNNGQKIYEKYTKKNILTNVFLGYGGIRQVIFKNFFKNQKTINIQGNEFLPIDYKKIMDIIKNYYLFFPDSVIFFTDNGFEQISVDDFHEKKNKYKDIMRLTTSEKEFAFLLFVFFTEMQQKLKEIDGTKYFYQMMKEIVSVFPKKKELQFFKIKYVFCYWDQTPGLRPFFSYKNIKTTRGCNLGSFIASFDKIVKATGINIKITIQNQKEIQIEEETFLKIPTKTINFLKKELKDLILFEGNMCLNIFESKNINYIIKPSELETKKKKIIEEQDKKITEYFRKNSIPAIMDVEINELPKIMKKCLLTLSELKSYCF